MTKKYPRPCKSCQRSMRPQSKTSHLRYPEAEVTHHARGMCKACAARDHYGRTHLIGKPVRDYGPSTSRMMQEPITFKMLTRMGEIHPPTAKYITDRRRRGIPTSGLRKQRAT